jgi:hypothetical protein
MIETYSLRATSDTTGVPRFVPGAHRRVPQLRLYAATDFEARTAKPSSAALEMQAICNHVWGV